MGQLEIIVALVGFVVTIVGAVLYLRADARANRQEWKADLATVMGAINGVKDDVAQLDRGLTALEVKVDAMAEKLDTKAEESTVQRNHRELLIRLAFHHHGDGRYPVVAATDPEPVNPSEGDV